VGDSQQEEGELSTTRSADYRELTILDVAEAAQVSKSTVSRVLNGSPYVASETRERVLAVVAKLDFRANTAAQGLRTTRSRLVGLLVPAIDNDMFAATAEVIEQELRRSGIGLVITSSGWDAAGERLSLESLRDRRLDGLVVSVVNESDPDLPARLAGIARTVVLLDREIPGVTADVVLTDQRAGIERAVDHLAALGHQTVGIATISQDVRPGREAMSAFADSAARHGLETAQVVIPYDRIDRASGWEIVERMLERRATAILCFVPNTVTAGVLECLDQKGILVPEELSLIGFDESELASVKKPQLTVVFRPIHDLALRAARMMVTRLAEPDLPPRTEIIRMGLMVRGSTAAPMTVVSVV
jgi:LacI family transcriptional regulator